MQVIRRTGLFIEVCVYTMSARRARRHGTGMCRAVQHLRRECSALQRSDATRKPDLYARGVPGPAPTKIGVKTRTDRAHERPTLLGDGKSVTRPRE